MLFAELWTCLAAVLRPLRAEVSALIIFSSYHEMIKRSLGKGFQIMRHYIVAFACCLMVLGSFSSAYAGRDLTPKFLEYLFTPAPKDLNRPYMVHKRDAYDSDWEYPHWSPYEWARDVGTAQDVIEQFYATGVLRDQYVDDGTPILQVGQTFLELSGRDQRRVVKFVAFAFGVDGLTGNGVMEICLERKGEPLGLYSQGLVQLH